MKKNDILLIATVGINLFLFFRMQSTLPIAIASTTSLQPSSFVLLLFQFGFLTLLFYTLTTSVRLLIKEEISEKAVGKSMYLTIILLFLYLILILFPLLLTL